MREGAVDLRGIRVLVVEDDPDSRDLVERLLSDEGAEVTPAASGQEGLASMRERRPDVLVSDIGMDGLDGYALLEEIRRIEEATGLVPMPAIALTAFDDIVHMRRAGSAGYQRHLSKPIDPARLVRAVAELAGRLSSGAAGA